MYEGGFEQGKKSGVGELTQSDGSIYTGNFRDDLMDGQGEYVWKNGNSTTRASRRSFIELQSVLSA